MKLAIMQPYFLPYIGYFQLINAVDLFVVYDNIKYTKKGWINRNRMLLNGTDAVFSLPLKKDSDHLDVVQRELSADFDRTKLLNRFKGAYHGAPNFEATYNLIERIVMCEENNLFRYIRNSVAEICGYLGIGTPIRDSSGIAIEHGLKGEEKVLELCRATGADTYINAIGGTDLYSRATFDEHGITLKFLKTKNFDYQQFGNEFVPWLSIVDVLMFSPLDMVRDRIAHHYELV